MMGNDVGVNLTAFRFASSRQGKEWVQEHRSKDVVTEEFGRDHWNPLRDSSALRRVVTSA